MCGSWSGMVVVFMSVVCIICMYKAIQQGIPIYPITANNNNDDTYYTIRDDYTITAIIIEMRPLL